VCFLVQSLHHNDHITNFAFIGAHLADVSVWINVAKAVAGLTITRALDSNGNEIDPVAETTDGILSCVIYSIKDIV
jgi:hypothetical protein